MTELGFLIGMFLVLVVLSRLKPAATHLFLLPVVVTGGLLLKPVPFINMVSGLSGYLDGILIVATGLILIYVLKETGVLLNLSQSWATCCKNKPFLLLLALLILGMLPGMFTGSALLGLLISSTYLLPVLRKIGFTSGQAEAFVIFSAMLGMIAPPVNIPLVIYSGLTDVTYVGYAASLWTVVLPGMLITVLYFYWTSKGNFRPYQGELSKLAVGDYLGLLIVLLGALLKLALPMTFFGVSNWPLILFVAALLQWLVKREHNLIRIAEKGISAGLQQLGTLLVSGVFVHIITYVGIKGTLVSGALELPAVVLIALWVIALLLLGGLWESLGMLFAIPLILSVSGDFSWIGTLTSVWIALGFTLSLLYKKLVRGSFGLKEGV